jgi:hypothetical protein
MRQPTASHVSRPVLRGSGGALALVACTLIIGCGGRPAPVPDAEVERAREVVAAYKQELVETLVAALNEGGPAGAIAACREAAPEIAAARTAAGVQVGRTSHRLRNPENAPPPWVAPLLAAYLEDPGQGQPRAVPLEAGSFGYVEPIRMLSFCLSCHGPAIDPPLAAALRELYPEDRATGFRQGEIRGVAWAVLPLQEGG